MCVPFGCTPHISPPQNNKFAEVISYQYAYPAPDDDINFLYGVDICDVKQKYAADDSARLSFFVNIRKAMYENIHNGVSLMHEMRDFVAELLFFKN